MNTTSTFAVLNCLLLIGCFQLLGMWAAPTLQAKKEVPILSSDIKRDVGYRNTLFGAYSCCVKKATEAVTANYSNMWVTVLLEYIIHLLHHIHVLL